MNHLVSHRLLHLLAPCFLSAATGAPLPVDNASFENPALAAGQWTHTLQEGWFLNSSNTQGAIIEHIAGFAHHGQNHLGLVSGELAYQDTATVFQPNTVYTLRVAVGHRSNFTDSANASLYKITALLPDAFVENIVNASVLAAPGTFVEAPPLTFSTAEMPQAVGRGIGLEFMSAGPNRAHFDNVRLDVTSLLVTTNQDDGPGSLRRAMADARHGDTILFDPAVFNGEPGDTIVLASPLSLVEAKSITIDANHIPGGVTISGNESHPCFRFSGNREHTLRGLHITKGRSTDGGGGISTDGSVVLYLENCTVSRNTAVDDGGALTLRGFSLVSLTNCTVHGNAARFGGAIFVDQGAGLTVRNSTITENSAIDCCGGIVQRGSLYVINSIVADNTAILGGDINLESALLSIDGNNIIGNNATVESHFPAGHPNANGDIVGTSASRINPLLSLLSDNGGPSPTRLPLPGSPALNTGQSTASLPAKDQRGSRRPLGTAPDIGAVEVEWNPNLAASGPKLTGLWRFDNSSNAMQASIGTALATAGTPPQWSATQSDDAGLALRGVIATRQGAANRLVATHGIAPNNGAYVNRYTILMDVLSPPASRNAWRALYQTNTSNQNDADYYIAPDHTVGTSAASGIGYGPAINDAQWQRVVIVVVNGSFLSTWINGALHHSHIAGSVDGRMSLDPQVLFFADDGGDNAPLFVGAIAMWDKALAPSEIAALAGPGAPIPPDGQITSPLDDVVAFPSLNSPADEGPSNAVDDKIFTKYLHFDRLMTGLEVQPAIGLTRLTGLRLTSANDAPGRDPASYIVQGQVGTGSWQPIAAGIVPDFPDRRTTQEFRFDETASPCTRYRIVFPTVKSATAEGENNSMQIAEIDLLGIPVDRTLRIVKIAPVASTDSFRRFMIVWAGEPYANYGWERDDSIDPENPWPIAAPSLTPPSHPSDAVWHTELSAPMEWPQAFFRVFQQ